MNMLMLTIGFRPNVGGIETHFDDFLKAAAKKAINTTVLTYQPISAKIYGKTIEKGKRWTIYRLPIISGFFYHLVQKPILEFVYLVPGLFLVTPFLLFKNIDVIHAHGLISGFAGVFWGKIFGKRIIVSTHSIYHFPKSGFYRDFAKYIFSNADAVLCLSDQSVREIKSLGATPTGGIKKFTYWVDLQKFKPVKKEITKKKLGWEKKFVVLFVGRLISEKGVRELLQAASKWNNNISIAIAGVGPLEDEVKSQMSKVENMIFLGKIDNEKLPIYYNAADVLIVPSTHEEGFGRVLLESLACGTPVIAANRGGIVEAINDKVGFLIKITPENIKKVVEYCYTHQLKLEDKSREARKFAESNFSEKNITEIINSYE